MTLNELTGPELYGRQLVNAKAKAKAQPKPIAHPAHSTTVHTPTVHTTKIVKAPTKAPSHPSTSRPPARKSQPATVQRHPNTATPTAVVWPTAPKKRIQPLRIPTQPGDITSEPTPSVHIADAIWPTPSSRRIQPIRTTTVSPNAGPKPQPSQPEQPDQPDTPYVPDVQPDPIVYPGGSSDPLHPGDNMPAVMPGGDDSPGNPGSSLLTNQVYPSSSPGSAQDDTTPEMIVGGLVLIGLFYFLHK